jgi:hypothetical protein
MSVVKCLVGGYGSYNLIILYLYWRGFPMLPPGPQRIKYCPCQIELITYVVVHHMLRWSLLQPA